MAPILEYCQISGAPATAGISALDTSSNIARSDIASLNSRSANQGGMIAGLVILGVAFFGIFGLIGFCMNRPRSRSQHSQDQVYENRENMASDESNVPEIVSPVSFPDDLANAGSGEPPSEQSQNDSQLRSARRVRHPSPPPSGSSVNHPRAAYQIGRATIRPFRRHASISRSRNSRRRSRHGPRMSYRPRSARLPTIRETRTSSAGQASRASGSTLVAGPSGDASSEASGSSSQNRPRSVIAENSPALRERRLEIEEEDDEWQDDTQAGEKGKNVIELKPLPSTTRHQQGDDDSDDGGVGPSTTR
ncbi:hypothetical protein F4779DRAFT_637302 [Xylariaceae sp. FL0662B]|nr:hypothetical protein F4779DRAFT_637302 [Xylariaceae sp. FL0662B]